MFWRAVQNYLKARTSARENRARQHALWRSLCSPAGHQLQKKDRDFEKKKVAQQKKHSDFKKNGLFFDTVATFTASSAKNENVLRVASVGYSTRRNSQNIFRFLHLKL